MITFHCTVDPIYTIPEGRFTDTCFIDQRLSAVPEKVRGRMRTVLRYIYEINGPTNLPLDRFKPTEIYLEPAEAIIARWLRTRTNGNLRSTFGKNALIAARKSRYRCCKCSFPDVRTLEIDHVLGRGNTTDFACLCANCHKLKTRQDTTLVHKPVLDHHPAILRVAS